MVWRSNGPARANSSLGRSARAEPRPDRRAQAFRRLPTGATAACRPSYSSRRNAISGWYHECRVFCQAKQAEQEQKVGAPMRLCRVSIPFEGEEYDERIQIYGRQQRRRVRLLCVYRGGGHLPDHSVEPHGRPGGPVVRCRQEEHLRHHGEGVRDAVRGRRRRRGARLAGRRRADHHLHGFPGSAPHDPQHVQDGRRAAAVRVPRQRAHAGHPGAVHLRRPLRRHGVPPDGLRHAGRDQRPGGHGPVGRGAPVRHQGPHPLHQFLRRIPHLPRSAEDRRVGLRGPRRHVRHGGRERIPRACAEPRPTPTA